MEKITKIKKLSDLDLKNCYLITNNVVYNLFKHEINCQNILILEEKNYSENVKNFRNVENIIKFFSKHNLDRDQSVYVLGGGSCGDIASFACSIYKRGIQFINIPTTLLSCVDSSIGGKNAINFNGIKNNIGTFWSASEVILVENIISNFNDEIINYGKGEIFKYILLSNDIEPFNLQNSNLLEVIFKCIKFKQSIVEKDCFDTNLRFCLNLGHSIGHVIESELKIPHGNAITYGIFYEHLVLNKLNIVSDECFLQITKLFKTFNLPKINIKNLDFNSKLTQDKKIKNKQLVLPYIKKIGQFDFVNIKVTTLIEVLNENI